MNPLSHRTLFFLALLYGLLAAAGAFMIEVLVLGTIHTPTALLFGSMLEEGVKLAFLMAWSQRFAFHLVSQRYRLIIAIIFGIGFSLAELSIATPPTFSIILSLMSIHIITALILGYVAIFKRNSLIALCIGFFLACSIHIAYNLSFATSLQ